MLNNEQGELGSLVRGVTWWTVDLQGFCGRGTGGGGGGVSDNTHLRISYLLHNKAGDSIRWIIGQQFVLRLSIVFEKDLFGF